MLGIRIGHQIGIRTEIVRSLCVPRRSRNRPWSCASFATLTTPGTDCAEAHLELRTTQNGSGAANDRIVAARWPPASAPRDANAIPVDLVRVTGSVANQQPDALQKQQHGV